MQHTIPVDQLGPTGAGMARAVEQCVHCGFCLPTCPTYVTLGEEMDSPRGRIVLMKSALEGAITAEGTQPFVDRCLGCMACVTACPSGVRYGELLMPYRARTEKTRPRTLSEKLTRTLVRETLPYPRRFRLAASAGKLAAPLQRLLPRLLPPSLSAMLALLPDRLPPATALPLVYPAEGKRRARVALLSGCVQQVLAPDINWATLRVLAHHGIEVVIPQGQGCCGSLMMHTGEDEIARHFARRNLRTFPHDVDAIVTNAAGCGSGMKEYGLLFKGCTEEVEARAFAGHVRDVSEFLADFDGAYALTPTIASEPLAKPIRLAYHDACHLAHAQGVVDAPRRLLQSIPNLTLVDIPEGELCCGSAGTYNVEQPSLADSIGRRKAQNILRVEPDAVAAGNIGCIVQIRMQLARLHKPLPVLHTIEVLDRAYRHSEIAAA
ncbi:MAG: heterodisulfide reductase-related iron-sulfur binding cluster [Chloroflexi bacterium]|nr:heterodisulfide reductase-related iron-sulfur binding cluster [Chloroflexota bacterium]